jgi:PAS domain S-box-containing protein
MTKSADRSQQPHNKRVTGRSESPNYLSSPEEKIKLYEAVLSRISDFNQAYDRNGRIIFVNQALLDLWGLKLEDVVGKDFFDLNYPDDLAARIRDQIAQVFATGQGLRDQTPYTSPTGKEGFYEYIFQPVFDESGEVEMVVGSTRDITERKQAEEAHRENERSLEEMANAIPQLAWMADPDGHIFWYNRQWYEYTGTTLADVKGWRWESVHDPEVLPKVSSEWKRSIATGQPFEMEFPLRRHDGRFQWFLTRATPFRAADGSVKRWFGTNTNIEEIRNIRLRSEEANRAKDEFLAMLSHELRAPLNLMAGWSQILKVTDYQEDLVRKAIDIIFRNVELQSTLIEDLLDVSRIVSERIEIASENVLLDEIVRETVQVAESLADKKAIVIRLSVSASPVVVTGDRARLTQIVQNLLNNSLKFTPDGGKINVALSTREGFACLGVMDNGIGIADEMLPFIFERFRQADTTSTRAFGGLGLGLTIVESLVKMHGGRVSARSDGLNHGAEFLVEIPLASVYAQPSTTAAGLGESEMTSLAGSRVLLVDDDPDSLELMGMFLELEGMAVTRSSNVPDALEKLGGGDFDMVISDLGMPDMDGYDLIRELRSSFDSSRLPAIALTGFVSESDRATVTAAGFQAHVAKPVEFDELITKIRELITLARVDA